MKTRMIKPLALALALGVGLGAATAQAQGILDVGGAGVIGDTTLTATAGVAKVPTDGGANWTAAGGEDVKYSSLISPAVAVGANGPVTLKFTHRYNFESGWDGGAVYVSVNGAPATHLAETAFSANGYVSDLSANNSSVFTGGLKVFTGQSTDWGVPTLIESVANLGELTAEDTVSVVFRGGWDESAFPAAPNWEIGTVEITNSAPSAILNVNFTTAGTSGFTVVSDPGLQGPWTYPKPISRFEIHADTPLAADRYAAAPAGSVIDLNGALLSVALLTGTLDVGDSFTLFDLSAGTTLTGTYESISLPGGTWDVSTLAVDGTITLLQLPALIEETFNYAAEANLNGQNGGNGFSGPWEMSKDTNLIESGSSHWGGLAWSGNRLSPTAWAAVERPIGTTLADADLMGNGKTLWFSYVMDIFGQNLTNLDFNFALCSDGFYWNGDVNSSYPDRTNLTSGEGIGVSNTTAGNIRAAYWQNSDADPIAERVSPLQTTTLQLNATNKARALIVGKIEWGATDADPEKLTLYAPGPDLALGTPILDSWSTPALNQSLFDRVSIEWKDAQAAIDEIRLGASAAEVLPVDVLAPVLASTTPANGDPAASALVLQATFDEPIFVGTGDIRLYDQTGPTLLETIPVGDAKVTATQFGLTIDPAFAFVPGNSYYFEMDAGVVQDYATNPFAGFTGSATWGFTVETTPATVSSIDDNVGGGPIYEDQALVIFTVTFNEPMDGSTVGASDFDCVTSGSAGFSIGTVTQVSPMVFTVQVLPTGTGSIQLRIPAGSVIKDASGNSLVVPVLDATTITIDAGTTPNTGIRYWDGPNTTGITDGASDGGDGTWDTATANWDKGAGFSHTAWDNTHLSDAANFGGTLGTVTLGADIDLAALNIRNASGNWIFEAGTGYSLNFSSGGSILFNDTAASRTATIKPRITGSPTATITAGETLVLDAQTGLPQTLGNVAVNPRVDGTADNKLTLQGSTTGNSVGDITLTTTNNGQRTSIEKRGSGTWTTGGMLGQYNSRLRMLLFDNGRLIVNGDIYGAELNFGSATVTLELQQSGDLFTVPPVTGTNTPFNSITALRGTIDNSSGGAITFAGNPPITFNGNFTLAGDSVNLGTGAVVLGTAIRQVTVQNAASTLTLGGASTATTGGLTKLGDGTLKLQGVNLNTGATTVTAGTLHLAAGSEKSAITVNSGASLGFTLGNSITSTAAVTLASGSKIRITDTPTLPSYTLITASAPISISGVTLDPPVGGYTLVTDGNSLKLQAAGYASWQSANSTAQTLDQDHDNDGAANGIEYFIGGPNGNTTGFTPLPGVTNTGGTLSVTWTHAADYAGVYGTHFFVETSATMEVGSWTTETLGVNVVITGDNVTYTFPAGTKNFVRLKVTGP